MFDLNAILSAALTAAVTEAMKPLLERVEELETQLKCHANFDLTRMEQRIEALENIAAEYSPTVPINEARLVEVLDQQEWFWEKLMHKAGEAAESAVEEAMNDHCSTYDHDDYDRAVTAIEDADLDDIVTYSNIKDAVGEALNNATLSISV